MYMGNRGRLFVVSFLVYACINVIENFLHYNIGRNEDRHSYLVREISLPSFHDWIKIVFVMLLFATLQASLTSVWME